MKNTEFGEVTIWYDDGTFHEGETGYYELYIDGAENLVGNINDDTGLQINVHRKGELIDSVKFVYDVDSEIINVVVLSVTSLKVCSTALCELVEVEITSLLELIRNLKLFY